MDDDVKKTRKKHVIERKENGHFAKGKSANPNGRPEGARNKFSISMLEEAIRAEEKDVEKQRGFGISVFQQFVRMAYREPSVMIALMRKFVPDKQYTEITGIEPMKFEVEILNGNKKPESK